MDSIILAVCRSFGCIPKISGSNAKTSTSNAAIRPKEPNRIIETEYRVLTL